jgi:transposase
MDQVHVVRHKVLVEGLGIRRVAREQGISRNTVKKYLAKAVPTREAVKGRKKPVTDRVAPRVKQLLSESPQWTGGKQRLTAARVHAMLLEEGFSVGRTTVRKLVAEWRRQRQEVFVPLEYAAGELAQVDFFEVLIDLEGKRQKAWMFVMRWMHSKRDFATLYLRQDQPSFLDGHVRAFAHFGCVPQRIAYDNLKAAVCKLLVGSERELSPRFEALSSHYLFEASFCRPRTGHDKGGVEARGKGIRWQHLVPIPKADTLAAMRVALLARLDATHDQARFVEERGRSLPLAATPFDPRRALPASVTRRSLVRVEAGHYSVPCAWAGLDVMVHVGPDDVRIIGPGDECIMHARVHSGQRSIDYTHYIRELATKPQAVRQVAGSLIQSLGPSYAATWRVLVDSHGPKQAARVFAKVLSFVETRGIAAVSQTLEHALVHDIPPLLALVPAPDPGPTVQQDQLPLGLRSLEVTSGQAADYDRLFLTRGES